MRVGAGKRTLSHREVAKLYESLDGASELKLEALIRATGLSSVSLIQALALHWAEQWAKGEFPNYRIPKIRLQDLEPEDDDPPSAFTSR